MKTHLYLAGPMRGYPQFNFPAFDQAKRELTRMGYIVTSPADLDRDEGFDETTTEVSDEFLQEAMARDIAAIMQVDGLALLPGWEQSQGVAVEITVARALGKPIAEYVEPTTQKSGALQVLGGTPPATAQVSSPLPAGEVRITDPSTGAQKGQKLAQLGAVDPQAVLRVAEVAGFGSTKYKRYNFAPGFAWSLSFDAMQRHLLAFWGGQDKDPESGNFHLAHAAWHALALLSFIERGRGTDDRFPQ